MRQVQLLILMLDSSVTFKDQGDRAMRDQQKMEIQHVSGCSQVIIQVQ